jgi:hypothetical protein
LRTTLSPLRSKGVNDFGVHPRIAVTGRYRPSPTDARYLPPQTICRA